MRLKRPLKGSERGADVRMVQRALNKAPSQTTILVDGIYGETTKRRVRSFEIARSLIPNDGRFVQSTLDALWPYFDAYGRLRYRLYRVPPPKPVIPNLGPVVAGGKSVLDQDLTHATAGIPGYPAFDDGWVAGKPVIAPENMKITAQSGSQGGDAVYARGASTIEYWFGHLSSVPATGRQFAKGERFAFISWDHRHPHIHTGINTDRLLGHELIHHTDYSHGAPTVREQLERALT